MSSSKFGCEGNACRSCLTFAQRFCMGSALHSSSPLRCSFRITSSTLLVSFCCLEMLQVVAPTSWSCLGACNWCVCSWALPLPRWGPGTQACPVALTAVYCSASCEKTVKAASASPVRMHCSHSSLEASKIGSAAAFACAASSAASGSVQPDGSSTGRRYLWPVWLASCVDNATRRGRWVGSPVSCTTSNEAVRGVACGLARTKSMREPGLVGC